MLEELKKDVRKENDYLTRDVAEVIDLKVNSVRIKKSDGRTGWYKDYELEKIVPNADFFMLLTKVKMHTEHNDHYE